VKPPRWISWAFVAAAIVLAWPLLLPWIYDTHDGHYALYNAAQFDLALRDGQFPVRWLPDLFGGRGIPHFVFYHPLVFYLVAAIHALGPGFVVATKAVAIAAAAAAGPAMYAWLRESLPPASAAAGALAYALAPMHAVEIHVKGDPPAGLAFALVPLVLLAAGRASRRTRYGAPAFALACAALVLAHSVTAFLVAPFVAGWAVACRERGASGRSALHVVSGGLVGAALSAWQWLPALAEKRFVHIESAKGILFFDFREHFLAAWQWLSPLWGYHGSFAGTRDDMAFQVGPIQAAALVGAVLFWRRLPPGVVRRVAGWGLATAGFSLILTLEIARPLWEAVGPMKFVQFPWRYLAPAALGLAALVAVGCAAAPAVRVVIAACAAPAAIAGAFALVEGNRWYALVAAAYAAGGAVVGVAWRRTRGDAAPAVAAMLVVAALPWTAVPLHHRFKQEPAIVPIHESDLAPERVRLGIRRTAARDDYLPRTVEQIPPRDAAQEYLPPAGAIAPGPFEVLDGGPAPRLIERRSATWRLAPEGAGRVALELHDFPGWTARCGERDLVITTDAQGRIVLDLAPCGKAEVKIRFARTPVRRAAETASLVAVAAALAWGLALRRVS
jgi:hypothetical protein